MRVNDVIDLLTREFPNLRNSNFEITTPATPNYNCIAWAANDINRPWWPDGEENGFWPDGAPRQCEIASFLAAFSTLGYELCKGGEFESGYEKLALYTDAMSKPTHMARQLDTQMWTSKLGPFVDISHDTLEALEGREYGRVKCFLKRPIVE